MYKKILILASIAFLFSATTVLASSSYFTRHTLNSATATTTNVFMTPGTATSTLTFSSADVDFSNLYIINYASTSASVLNWKYQYSNNQVDWYDEDVVNSSVALGAGGYSFLHASSTVTHSWTTGNTTSSTTLKVLSLPNVVAGWTRIVFSLPIGSTNSTIYAELLAKRLPQ